MVLSGGLSNHSLVDLLNCLTRVRPDQGLDQEPKETAGWPDGRRQFGQVSGAIVVVLSETASEMRLRDIHAGVERVLGGRVSFQSVADYLLTRSKGPRPLFVRTRYGHYQLS